MSRKGGGTIAALDVGSSKVACFIGEREEEKLFIRGIGHQLSQGFKAGVVTDVGLLETSILSAVHAAEEMAGETIDRVVLNLSGAKVTSDMLRCELPLVDGMVTERDIHRIAEFARNQIKRQDRRVIHCIPISYQLDDVAGILDPRGMVGRVLCADFNLVSASNNLLRNIVQCVNRCHLNVEDLVASPYASALACLSADEMDLGVVLVDIGGATSSVAVYGQSRLLYAGVIPVGGIHITNDIAQGLSISFATAERLKALHGNAQVMPRDYEDVFDVPGLAESDHEGDHVFQRAQLTGIIAPRVEEILELVARQIEQSGISRMAPKRFVLTGGASQLSGMREVFARFFSAQVRIGRPKQLPGLADAVATPTFSTCMGLLLHQQARHKELTQAAAREPVSSSGRLGRLVKWFVENF